MILLYYLFLFPSIFRVVVVAIYLHFFLWLLLLALSARCGEYTSQKLCNELANSRALFIKDGIPEPRSVYVENIYF